MLSSQSSSSLTIVAIIALLILLSAIGYHFYNSSSSLGMFVAANPMQVNDTPSTTEANPRPFESDNRNDSTPMGFDKRPDYNPNRKQVFHIGSNIFNYNEAAAVCKAFGADLATYEQIVDAYKNGADWCSYGWIKGQMAVYPTQPETWAKLQENPPDQRNICGKVGINGGYFDNPESQFGVSCYGVKPAPRDHERTKHHLRSQKDYEMERMVEKVRQQIPQLTVVPFNEDKWSNC